MPRFIAKPYGIDSWVVVDSLDNVELFGAKLPKTKLEADVCANAANAAARKVGTEIIASLIKHLQSELKRL
jgi:hypothetical protein